MTEYKGQYRIETIRLPYYDYSNSGLYFVTICTKNMRFHFGTVSGGRVVLSSVGQTSNQLWAAIPEHFPRVRVDSYIVMPNHLHGIIVIEPRRASENPGETRDLASLQTQGAAGRAIGKFGPLKSRSLSSIIHSYKSSVTRWCRTNGFPDFRWQPRFYEHIIRTEEALDQIRGYIIENPVKWEFEKNTPENLFPFKRDARSRVSTGEEPESEGADR